MSGPEAAPRRSGIGVAAFLGMLGSGATILASIARAKVTALTVGPEGVGVIGEVMQVVTMATVFVGVLTGPALTRALTASEDMAETFRASLGSIALLMVGASLLTVLGTPYLLESTDMRIMVSCVALGCLGACGGTAINALAQLANVREAFGIASSTTVLFHVSVAIGAVSGVLLGGVTGSFVGAVVATGLVLPFLQRRMARGLGFASLRPRLAFRWDFILQGLQLGVVGVLVILCWQSALLWTRNRLHAQGGDDLSGQFQAAWAVATTYFATALAGVGNYSFPRFAAAKTHEEVAAEVEHARQFVSRVAMPLILAVIALRQVVMLVLYSDRFAPAGELFGELAIGDLARAYGWCWVGPLMLRGHPRGWLVAESAGMAGIWGLSWVLVPRLGLDGFAVASNASLLALALWSQFVTTRVLQLRWRWRPALELVALTALLTGAWAVSTHWSFGWAVVLGLALAHAAATGLLRQVFQAVLRRVSPRGPAPPEAST